jgi:hypothetical protein
MARARLLKPGLFANETLAELPFETRLLFPGLWTIADREGRLEDHPVRIRAQLFPYDNVDVERMLSELAAAGFIVRYTVAGARYIEIPKFLLHQRPHIREAASEIPPPTEGHQPRHSLGSAEAEPRSPVSVSDPVSVPETVSIPVSKSGSKTVTVSKSCRLEKLHAIASETLQYVKSGNEEELDDHFRYIARSQNVSGITKAEVRNALQAVITGRTERRAAG